MFLSTPNLNWLVGCQRDADLRNSVIDNDLSVVDSMPWFGLPDGWESPLRKVAGSAISRFACKPDWHMSVFFGGPGIAEEAASTQ
jgi:N-acetylglucosaminyldiphosphoundecaprenol N-acetyl-beta-D-mannosaminyltransferase